MISRQIERFVDVLIERKIRTVEDRDIMVYGLSSMIEIGFNIITTVILGLLFGMLLESIVFLLSFSFLRTYAGGYHCKNAINCYFMSSGTVLLALLIAKFIPKSYMFFISLVLLLISIQIILKLAPVGTPGKLLDEGEKIYYRKKTVTNLIIECIVIVIFFIIKAYDFYFLMSLGIAVVACLTNINKQYT